MGPPGAFDVERFRAEDARTVVVRTVDRPMLVLGSTQRDSVVDHEALRRLGVDLVRRRSGGGAVFLGVDDPVWLDVWVPADDPLFDPDVRAGARWIGEWWIRALDLSHASVHDGPAQCSAASKDACFGGIGPGEVVVGGRKLVGVAQWRSREGALSHVAAYRQWRSEPLVSLFDHTPERREEMARDLESRVTGWHGVRGATDREQLVELLVGTLPAGPPWNVTRV